MTAEYALDELHAPISGEGASLTPFAPRKRAAEWGVRAIIVGDKARLSPWIRDLGRRAVTVECVTMSHIKNVEDAIALITGYRAQLVVLVGARAVLLGPSIVDCRPGVAVVTASATERDEPEDEMVEWISEDAGPKDLVLAIRRALKMSKMRAELAQTSRLAERQRVELERLNGGIRKSLAERHQEMCETKRAWERTFDAVGTPLAVVDRDFVVLNANRAYAAVAKEPVAQVPGNRCHSVLFGRGSPCSGCPIVAGTRRAEVTDVSGTTFELAATPLDDDAGSYVCAYRDLTKDREKFEDRIRAERMAALGEMSAGLAHELNNPIGGILAMAQALSRDDDVLRNAELKLDLADIEEAAKRSRSILQALLRYARGSTGDDNTSVDVAEGISDALIVVKADFRAAKIVVDITAEQGAALVSGNASAFQEAMVHLLRNAADAVTPPDEKAPAPKITIRTLSQGDEVWVEVADNGRGLPSLEDDTLLVPFVSDDGRAAGKGIGLALVSRLIDNSMGRVELHRQAGGGTTVRLRLRAVH